MNKAIFKVLGLFLFALVVPSLASAYIPPSQYLVNQVVKKRAKKKKLWIASKIILFDDGEPTNQTLMEVVVVDYVKKNIQSRIFATNELGKKVLIFATVRKLYSKAKGVEDTGPITNLLLFGARSDEVTRELMINGVPIQRESALALLEDELARRKAENTSLRRWNKKFMWVIGKELSGSVRSQLWLEKDSFLPSRLVKRLTDDLDDQMEIAEVRLSDHRFSRGYNYPGKIQFLRGEEIQFEVNLSKIAVNPKKKYKLPEERGLTEAGNDESSDIRKLITRFYKTIR